MSYTFRTCIIDADDTLYPCTPADYARLAGGALALPRFAGRRLRSAHLAIEHERGRPTGWLHEDYVWLTFDAAGALTRDAARWKVRLALAASADLTPPSPERRAATRRAIATLSNPASPTWSPSPPLRARIVSLAAPSFPDFEMHR